MSFSEAQQQTACQSGGRGSGQRGHRGTERHRERERERELEGPWRLGPPSVDSGRKRDSSKAEVTLPSAVRRQNYNK